jgi:hypothetical protein
MVDNQYVYHRMLIYQPDNEYSSAICHRTQLPEREEKLVRVLSDFNCVLYFGQFYGGFQQLHGHRSERRQSHVCGRLLYGAAVSALYNGVLRAETQNKIT